nr:hypothetical protein [uncultured Methanolobus sp.]
MNKNETNLEDEILYHLRKNTKMRTEELITAIVDDHKQTIKHGEKTKQNTTTGYSRSTIIRTLNDMVKSKNILRLNKEELNRYGYNITDGKATYIFTPESFELKTHIDKVLNLLKNGDESDKQMALKELTRYDKLYSFDESQLDLLVENLNSVDADLTNKFVVTLKNYIVDKNKEPTNREKLLIALRCVLDKYGSPKGKSGHVRNSVLCLLTHYKDEGIIDQIIKDATMLDNPQEVEEDYDITAIAELVVNNPSKLFEVERQMFKEGKTNSVDFISNIRSESMQQLGMSNLPKRNTNIEGSGF